MRLVYGLLAVLCACAPVRSASAQVLGSASAAVRGSGQSGGSSSGRSSGGSSSGGSSSGSPGGSSSSGAGCSTRRRPTLKCRPGQSQVECLRERWAESGLADLGGVFFFWATVLGEYPYADGSGGYAVPAVDEEGEEREARIAGRLSLDGGYVLAGAGRLGAAARVQLPFFVDFSTRYSLYFEPVDDTVDALLIGRSGLDVRILDANGAQLRLGVELLHFHDAQGSVLGPSLGLALEVFPFAPVVLSAQTRFGIVGEAAVVLAEVRLGFLVDGTELFVGYRYEGVLGEVASVDLGGPTLGVRQWL